MYVILLIFNSSVYNIPAFAHYTYQTYKCNKGWIKFCRCISRLFATCGNCCPYIRPVYPYWPAVVVSDLSKCSFKFLKVVFLIVTWIIFCWWINEHIVCKTASYVICLLLYYVTSMLQNGTRNLRNQHNYCVRWFIHLTWLFCRGGHLGLAVWCGVSHCVEDRVATSRCLFLVISVRRWNVVSLTCIPYSFFFICTCSYMY
jgi:hypothetical protein